MRRFFRLFLFIILLICFSCEERGWFVKCHDCVQDEPMTAMLHMKLSEPTSAIKIRIFEGDLEDSVLYHSDNVTWSQYSFEVPLNKKYSVTATYNFDNESYTAVDSATPRVKYTEDQCDDPCYFVYDNDLDLRIKYTAGSK